MSWQQTTCLFCLYFAGVSGGGGGGGVLDRSTEALNLRDSNMEIIAATGEIKNLIWKKLTYFEDGLWPA